MMFRLFYVFLIFFFPIMFSCEHEENIIDAPWQYDHPLDHAVNSRELLEMDYEIENGKYGNVNSVLIIRNDKIIFENYYNDTERNDLQPLNGATMSITSAISGIAIEDEKYNLSLNDRVIDYFPDYSVHFEDIPQKDKIDFSHLLNHLSGWWWDEQDLSFYDDENEAQLMLEQANWIDFILSHKMIRVPGQFFNYNSGNAVIAGAMIEKAVDMPVREFADKKLFEPLEIDNWEWSSNHNNVTNTAFGLKMNTLDFAKIGYLYLNNGHWAKRQVINENWVSNSTRTEVSLASYNFGKYWWRPSTSHFVTGKLTINDMFFAWGEGGQFLFIIPHKEMVIATTADNYSGHTELYAFQLLVDFILPAASEFSSEFK